MPNRPVFQTIYNIKTKSLCFGDANLSTVICYEQKFSAATNLSATNIFTSKINLILFQKMIPKNTKIIYSFQYLSNKSTESTIYALDTT